MTYSYNNSSINRHFVCLFVCFLFIWLGFVHPSLDDDEDEDYHNDDDNNRIPVRIIIVDH